jgi:hypothetical protein
VHLSRNNSGGSATVSNRISMIKDIEFDLRSTTKLIWLFLDFSTNFYQFYKRQLLQTTLKEKLAERPSGFYTWDPNMKT